MLVTRTHDDVVGAAGQLPARLFHGEIAVVARDVEEDRFREFAVVAEVDGRDHVVARDGQRAAHARDLDGAQLLAVGVEQHEHGADVERAVEIGVEHVEALAVGRSGDVDGARDLVAERRELLLALARGGLNEGQRQDEQEGPVAEPRGLGRRRSCRSFAPLRRR